MDIRLIIKIHENIELAATGNPKQFSCKLNVSERTLYNYLAFMKNELKAPIVFDEVKQSYLYNEKCNLKFINSYGN